VLICHRLGILGFLPPKLAPSAIDGNLGLKDVILGLRAVQKRISTFGGDKARVTIGGQSSGASLIRGMCPVRDADKADTASHVGRTRRKGIVPSGHPAV
jgi:carboxylesterase type B